MKHLAALALALSLCQPAQAGTTASIQDDAPWASLQGQYGQVRWNFGGQLDFASRTIFMQLKLIF